MTESICENCNEEIIMVCNNWYHSKGGKRLCEPIKRARPKAGVIIGKTVGTIEPPGEKDGKERQ